jgi:prevent-host-death family protein
MMTTINIFEAKTSLSKLIERVESGVEPEIIIARNGRPVARLVPIGARPVAARIGIAKGRFEVPDSIDDHNDEVAALFPGGERE